jgi:hypothetical protein
MMQAVVVAAFIARKRVHSRARFEKVSCLNRSIAVRNTARAAQRSARIGEYCFDMILKPKGGTLGVLWASLRTCQCVYSFALITKVRKQEPSRRYFETVRNHPILPLIDALIEFGEQLLMRLLRTGTFLSKRYIRGPATTALYRLITAALKERHLRALEQPRKRTPAMVEVVFSCSVSSA